MVSSQKHINKHPCLPTLASYLLWWFCWLTVEPKPRRSAVTSTHSQMLTTTCCSDVLGKQWSPRIPEETVLLVTSYSQVLLHVEVTFLVYNGAQEAQKKSAVVASYSQVLLHVAVMYLVNHGAQEPQKKQRLLLHPTLRYYRLQKWFDKMREKETSKHWEWTNSTHPLLAQEVSDFDVVILGRDASVDGEMSIHKAHLVAVTLGNPSDEIVDMADGGANGSHCFPGAEPRLHLQLPSPLLHLEIEVQVLEVPGQNSSRSSNPNLLRLDLDLHPSRKIHDLRRHDGLHDASTSFLSIELSETTAREVLLRSQGKWKKRARQ